MAPTETFTRSYGIFWWRGEIDWSPGSGNVNTLGLLGRVDESVLAFRRLVDADLAPREGYLLRSPGKVEDRFHRHRRWTHLGLTDD